MSPFSALALVVGARRNRERGFRSRKKPDSTKKQDRTDGGQKKAASSRGQSLSFALYVGAGVTFRALSRLSTILHKWMVIEHKLFQPLIQNMGVNFGRGHVRIAKASGSIAGQRRPQARYGWQRRQHQMKRYWSVSATLVARS
jgi:hypothetical protein